jgi:hypothetical protein
MIRRMALLLFMIGVAAGQRADNTGRVFVDAAKPGVYITFESLGKRVPLRAGETDEGWFLKIHNNTRWSLKFVALGELPKQNGDADLVYDVVEDPQGYPPSPIPTGNWFDVVSSETLLPGKVLSFSVPKANLGEGLGLKIRFQYEWDAGRVGEPEHSILFYHSQLPASLRKGERRRPGWMEGQFVGGPVPLPSPLPTTLTPPPEPVPPRKK